MLDGTQIPHRRPFHARFTLSPSCRSGDQFNKDAFGRNDFALRARCRAGAVEPELH